MIHAYTAYGIHIQSTLALPELKEAATVRSPDVKISSAVGLPRPKHVGGPRLSVRLRSDVIQLHWTQYGSFAIQDGTTIYYEPLPGEPDYTVRPPLLGVVLGTLLHQRGVFTLHASAVSMRGEAVAFLGRKGRGKSTTAAAFYVDGHPLVTDDVLAVSCAPDKPLRVHPGFPQIKLHPNSASILGLSDALEHPPAPEDNKAYLPSPEEFDTAPLPLRAIFVLETGQKLAVSRLTGHEAFTCLLREAYAPRFLGSAASTPSFFSMCKQVAHSVPIFRLTRPLTLECLEGIMAKIKRVCADEVRFLD
jgi:hypothetical protein